MSLSDIENRILDKLNDFDKKLDDLCNRMTKVESSLDNHYQDIEDDNNNRMLKKEWKTKKFYIMITILSSAIAVYSLVKDLI